MKWNRRIQVTTSSICRALNQFNNNNSNKAVSIPALFVSVNQLPALAPPRNWLFALRLASH